VAVRVRNNAGAQASALAIYNHVQLGPVGELMVAIAELYPRRHEIYVTSGMDGDHGPRPNGSHHYGLVFRGSGTAAIDIGAFDKAGFNEGARRMRAFAKWCDATFRGEIVELIHTAPDKGFYVRHGTKIGSFGSATDEAHRNHVHLAMSSAQVKRVLNRLRAARKAASAKATPAKAAPIKTVPTKAVPTTTAPAKVTPRPAAAAYDTRVKPIFGWDASDFDHGRGMRARHIVAAAAEGVRFFTHKATEHAPGEVFTHKAYGAKLNAARAAGIPFLGAYVVVRSGVAIATQARSAIDYVTAKTPWFATHPGFFWQVDLERWEYDAVPARLGEELAAELHRATGKPVVLYASHGQYGERLSGSRPLWNADYRSSGAARPFKAQWADVQRSHTRTTGKPWRGASGENFGFHRYSGRVPSILQFASDAVIGGQHTCDANVFLGTEADFARVIGAGPPATAAVPVTTAAPAAKKAAGAALAARVHRVKAGESLSSIAERYYGTTTRWRRIYTGNRTLIESTARARGLANSDGGNRVFPGTRLVIP
jgi:hypothetical protein